MLADVRPLASARNLSEADGETQKQLLCRAGLLRRVIGCADQHWSTVMGGPRLSIPGQTHSQQVNGVDPEATPEPPERGQGRDSLPKRDFPDPLRASKPSSPAKRRRFGAGDTEMDEPDQATASPSVNGYGTPAHVRQSSLDLTSLQVRLLWLGCMPCRSHAKHCIGKSSTMPSRSWLVDGTFQACFSRKDRIAKRKKLGHSDYIWLCPSNVVKLCSRALLMGTVVTFPPSKVIEDPLLLLQSASAVGPC